MRQSRAAHLTLIVAVFALLALAGLYGIRVRQNKTAQEIERLQAILDEHKRAIIVLRAEIAHLERPERLERIAAEKLGMEPGDPAPIGPEELAKRLPLLLTESGEQDE